MRFSRRGRWLRLGLGAAVATLAGCAPLLEQVVQEPQVSIIGLELDRFSLTEQRFSAQLEVHNPNSFRLPVRSFTWAVSVQDVHLADGVSDGEISIAAGATEPVRLEFGTNLLTSALGLMDWLRSPGETLDYRIEGEVRADLPFAPRIPYSREGTVELTR